MTLQLEAEAAVLPTRCNSCSSALRPSRMTSAATNKSARGSTVGVSPCTTRSSSARKLVCFADMAESYRGTVQAIKMTGECYRWVNE